jgi:hypothetical protein
MSNDVRKKLEALIDGVSPGRRAALRRLLLAAGVTALAAPASTLLAQTPDEGPTGDGKGKGQGRGKGDGEGRGKGKGDGKGRGRGKGTPPEPGEGRGRGRRGGGPA